ncbi:MAG TPA: Ig-like domain-containing protein [Mobilitalea sp.]|nr:Ig-like domain-containing protein [Mobilitalea sp.]
MKNKLLSKCLITFGFLLLFTLLLPFTSAKASSIDNEKDNGYRLNLKSITLVKGKSRALKVYPLGENAKLLFKSDDAEIASVSDDGTITASKVGNTIVTATIKDGATVTNLTCEVTVGLPAFSVKVTKSRMVIGLDKSDFLNVILKPSNTVEDARYSSNDSSIASVSTGGRITGKKYGLTYVFAEIDATDSDGTRKFSRCTVIVITPEDAPLLETYFNDHPELDYIPVDDLTKALDEYFNTKYDPTSSASFISNLNRFLDDKFKLADLRDKRNADLAKTQSN